MRLKKRDYQGKGTHNLVYISLYFCSINQLRNQLMPFFLFVDLPKNTNVRETKMNHSKHFSTGYPVKFIAIAALMPLNSLFRWICG